MSASTLREHRAEQAGRLSDAISPWRFFDVYVLRTLALGPHFLRVTLAGRDLDRFADVGADQRLKVVLPLPGNGTEWVPAGDERWWPRWHALSADRRHPVRTYTARAVRPDRHELDIDVVSHGGGAAASWFAAARRGDRLLVFGPTRAMRAIPGAASSTCRRPHDASCWPGTRLRYRRWRRSVLRCPRTSAGTCSSRCRTPATSVTSPC